MTAGAVILRCPGGLGLCHAYGDGLDAVAGDLTPEGKVDTAILLRRLESFFAKLPDRDRQVIDAYLGAHHDQQLTSSGESLTEGTSS